MFGLSENAALFGLTIICVTVIVIVIIVAVAKSKNLS